MLLEEVTLGIYPDGELIDVLIVPEGREYHLFLTRSSQGGSAIKKSTRLGSIVVNDNGWVYQGGELSNASQTEIANYILNYPDPDPEITA